MWSLTLWLNTLSAGVLVGTLACGVMDSVANTAPATGSLGCDPPAELLQPKPKPKIHTLGLFTGTVTAIGTDWFEVGAGWDGHLEVLKKHNDGNDKPVRVSVVSTLAGGDPKGLGRGRTYRLTDLKVGDVVSVDTGVTRAGEQFGLEITITRRPRGKIPPLPGEVVPPRPPDLPEWVVLEGSHARHQAEQDWEEKGIPIPKRFLNKDGRYPWTNPPYPPVAPQPRPAKP